jgi:hypothetical protein
MLNFVGKINQYIRSFISDDKAAVTVDWVVLTAGIVGMVVFVLQQITLPVESIASAVADGITQFGS